MHFLHYRGKDCRSNLYLLPTGEIVYFVAAVVVLFNVEEQCQRHYTGHTDDVKCIAIHPNKLIIASGQCAGHDRLDARVCTFNLDFVNLISTAMYEFRLLQKQDYSGKEKNVSLFKLIVLQKLNMFCE